MKNKKNKKTKKKEWNGTNVADEFKLLGKIGRGGFGTGLKKNKKKTPQFSMSSLRGTIFVLSVSLLYWVDEKIFYPFHQKTRKKKKKKHQQSTKQCTKTLA